MKKWIPRFMLTILLCGSTTILSSCKINDFQEARCTLPCCNVVRIIAEYFVRYANANCVVLADDYSDDSQDNNDDDFQGDNDEQELLAGARK